METNNTGSIGGTLEDFLTETGDHDHVYDTAIKRVLVWQMEKARKSADMSKSALAIAVGTSRSQIDRALDPANVAVSIDTLNRVAMALGKKLRIELVDAHRP